jgi:hypothetical protein
MEYYDDNFGQYTIESDEDVAFYWQMQRMSRTKRCQGCGQMVKIKYDYAYCNSCADARERGLDY